MKLLATALAVFRRSKTVGACSLNFMPTPFHCTRTINFGETRKLRSTSLSVTSAKTEGVEITDVEVELIAKKLRKEIDIPGVPSFMEQGLVELVLKTVIRHTALKLPEDEFHMLIAGEAGMDGLNKTIIRNINEQVDIPILSDEAKNQLVDNICEVFFSPMTFKKLRRMIVTRARASRDLLREDSRVKLATELNEMFDIPFVSEEKEQMIAEKLVSMAYHTLESIIPPEILDIVEDPPIEELCDLRNKLVEIINEKIDVPFVSEEKEEEVIRFIVDSFLSDYGLGEGTKNANERKALAERRLEALEIKLDATIALNEKMISDMTTKRDRLRAELTELASTYSPSPVDPEQVTVVEDADAVGQRIREIVAEAAEEAVTERGHFTIAITGGSILEMLAGDIPGKERWTPKTTVVYINHNCVPTDDIELATHAKAQKFFLGEWEGVNVLVTGGSDDAAKEASDYEDKIRALPHNILPRCTETRLPLFDISLITIGSDGSVGSLYPGRDEVLVGTYGDWVLPVEMKDPPSITLSLPAMLGKKPVVAAFGVSDKYKQGKCDVMRRAISIEGEVFEMFPAVGLRERSYYVLDEMAAIALDDGYFKPR